MSLEDKQLSRRGFVKSATLLAGWGALSADSLWAGISKRNDVLPLGVCTSYSNAELLRGLGYTFIEEGVGRFLIPDAKNGGDAQFEKNLAERKAVGMPILSYTSFFPGDLKSVGPELHHEAILQRTELALKRAKEIGSKNIVFGSGGSRRIPDGFDRAKAKQQHIELSKKMAPLAEKYGITISIEPLNASETNFVNSLADGAEIVQAVNSPWFRLLCDIYHMKKDDEGPEQILKYGKLITHCHIAEKANRTAPGVEGDDFRPYFKALKKVKYKKGLSLECRWKNFDSEVKTAIGVIQNQWRDA
jgi:sugar phosphate isomerase/epimerase